MYSALENDKVLRTYLASRWRKVQNYLQGQAMLNAALQNPNLSAAERAAVKEHARRRGIGAALGLLGGLVATAAERMRRQHDRAEQRAARKEKQIEAEMQALSAPPQAWKAAAQAYLAQKAWASFRVQERASVSLPPQEQPKRWWERAWDAITHPVQTLQNTLVQWGMRSPAGYKIIGGLAHFTAGLNDPERNPVTASFGKALRDGWAGFSYGVRSTLDLTYKTGASLLKGNWEGVKRYGGALLEGTLKGWLWGGIQTAGQLAWGGIKMATPIGLFETGPAWWSAIKDAWAGRRGGWDVVFTSLLLMANVIGIAGSVNGVKTSNEFRTFQDTLSPSAQSQYISLSTAEQIKIFNAARDTSTSPAAIEFYLDQIGRPGSPLAALPLEDALSISSLAVQSGRGAFVLDYIGRYGVTDALKIASPEVIRGMVNDQFLIQAQEMLDQNTGYNVSPESWFHLYSEIGSNQTYITNKTAITEVIGEFDGKGIIKITQTDAEVLAKALGLKPKSLNDGFRISRVTGIKNMKLSYPVEGNVYFLGPGRGLPGGGTEITISPSLPTDSPYIVEQVIVEVVP